MALTDLAVRRAAAEDRPKRFWDGDGLYLLVKPSGAKWWRFDYRHLGVRNTLSMGTYPEVTLAKARAKRADARTLLAEGRNPSEVRRRTDAKRRTASRETFTVIAEEWLEHQRPRFATTTIKKLEHITATHLTPALGDRPIARIEPPDLLEVLRTIEVGERHETAHRAKQIVSQVFRYAIATGRATRDPSADLRGALKPVIATSHAAVTNPIEIGKLLRTIDGYRGELVIRDAMLLAALLFVRPGELRQAEWAEIDFDHALWRIPASKMKMRSPHLVPLARQAIAVFKRLKIATGHGKYVFHSIRGRTGQPISNTTINQALRRLHFTHDQMTAHGFRAMASTRLNEMGFDSDVIERQLAHRERSVRAIYNRAQYLPERIAMMQAWADELDRLKALEPEA